MQEKSVGFFLSMVLLFTLITAIQLSVIPKVDATSSLWEEYNGTDDTAKHLYLAHWFAQNFLTNETQHTITSVKVKFYKSTGDPGIMTIGIRETNASNNYKPIGDDLTSGTIDANTFSELEAGVWYEVSVTEYALSINTNYSIVVRTPNAVQAHWRATVDTDAYIGQSYSTANSGGYWGEDLVDFTFEVWGNEGTGVAPEYDYVDSQSNVDSSVDVGTHSSFAAQQATDWTNDTLTESNTNTTALNDAENFVDANDSNIDSHTGHGASSNFTAQQDANVLYNDTLTEANTAGTTSDVFTDGFEDGTFGKWDGNGATTWTNDGGICTNSSNLEGWASTSHSGTYYAGTGATGDGNLVSDNIDLSGVTSFGVRFWYAVDDTDGAGELVLQYWDGAAYDTIADLSGGTEDTWTFYSAIITDNQYFDATFRIDFLAACSSNEAVYVDDVVINKTLANNYELDYEFSWTTASFSEANEYLCIRTNSYSGTAENLGVDVWTGSWTTLSASLTASTWNNISITTYLTSGTIYFRFIGKTESSDTAQNTWVIECNLVHTWSVGINYELDIEEQFTSANFSRTSEELCIRIGTMNGETLSVQWWNATSSTWLTIIASLSANQWNNVSVTTYLTAATFTIKFIDGTKTSDTSQSTWNKDACLLHTWDIANAAPTVADLRLSLISDTVNITTGITVNTWYDWEANVTDAETLNDISTVTIRIANNPSLAISADSAGYNESSVYWFRYTNTTDIWEWYSGAAWTATSNWIDGNCTNPTKTETNGFYLFRIRLSKVARYSSSWEFAALATDSVSNTATKTFTGISIAKYDELVMITTTHTWTNINIGGVNVLVDEGSILFNVSCNYNFKLQAQSNSSWVESGDGYKIGIGNITIDKDTLGSAVPLTVAYADIGGLTNLNTLTANTQYSFKLWATIPEDTAYDKTYAYKCQVQTEDA